MLYTVVSMEKARPSAAKKWEESGKKVGGILNN